MRLDINLSSIGIRPQDNTGTVGPADMRDTAFIESVLGLSRADDFVLLVRAHDQYAGLVTVAPDSYGSPVQTVVRQCRKHALAQLRRLRECAAENQQPGLDLAIETLQAAGYGNPSDEEGSST